MAKFECALKGDFEDLLDSLHEEITEASATASYEDGSMLDLGNVKVAVRVYERYSMVGSNRVSMNITVVEKGNSLYLTAITSGGSQALFYKVNTFGEESFLKSCVKAVEKYIDQ
ncbi:hypothetical protein GCM10008932_22410 [Alkalibacterium iburiense]|uniref:Uncharacterized protein n=1 Tax=Alkalibacterium iburiense TaxID=290589 RepID=A0ABP3HHG4_9LACT